jgi:hypothetical protein
MAGKLKTAILLIAWLCVSSCYESPEVDFHSYQELSEYEFIYNGFFPEILKEDATHIQATYDITNKHVFGDFDFKRRSEYDLVINSYSIANKDSLLERIKKIHQPRTPKWFIPKEDLLKDNYLIVKHQNFYLMMDRKINRIYFLR